MDLYVAASDGDRESVALVKITKASEKKKNFGLIERVKGDEIPLEASERPRRKEEERKIVSQVWLQWLIV